MSGDCEWFCARYKNHGHIEEYLGDTQPHWVEVVAVRFWQWINGCRSLDWTYENWIVALVRETGPGFRLGFFCSAFYIVVVTSIVLETPLVFEFDVHHLASDMRFGNVTVAVAFYLWTLDFGIVALSYYLCRHYGSPARPGAHGECTPFFRVAVVFSLYFFLAVFSIHTVLSHMYIRRNTEFAWLLVILLVTTFFSSVDDLTQIGSPWGIQEASKTASVLLSFRGLFLVPLTIVWSVAAIVASFPPSSCVEC